MNKQDLSKKWSKYCDTDKLVDDMMALLAKYNHRNSEHGVCVLLDKYFSNKEPLIKLFVTSKNYIGDMRICVQKEFERQISSNEINSFFCSFHEKLNTRAMLQFKDEDGKVLDDYLLTGKTSVNIAGLPSVNEQNSKKLKLERFNYDTTALSSSHKRYTDFCDYIRYFNGLYRAIIFESFNLKTDGTTPLLRKGTKASRAFNSMCQYYGVDKLNPQTEVTEHHGERVERTVYPYDKLFAQYSDLVSTLKRKMNFIISLNPLDYLTMSVGVSWNSCHHIKTGSYRGGCMSYMLDATSMITFVIGNIDGPIHEIPKLYRQMYHYKDNLFVQNRLYPQGNDGATDLYERFRGFVTDEFTNLLNVDGNWSCETGALACSSHTHSEGKHYKDYNHNNSCSIFYPSAKANDIRFNVMTIGHNGICPRCGGAHTLSSYLSHAYTSDCISF